MRRFGAVVLLCLAACGKRDVRPTPAPAAGPAPSASAPSEPSDAQRAVIVAQAARFTAASHELDGTALADAAPVVTAIHASARWKRAHDREPYNVLTPEALTAAHARARDLGAAFGNAAHALDGARTIAAVAAAMQTLSTAFDAAIHGGLGGLSSGVVEELVYDRDHVCTTPTAEPACARFSALDDAFRIANKVVPHLGVELRGAAAELDKAFGARDPHLHVVLARAAGTGPTFGEPCGPEQLCRWDHTCMTATATCEFACRDGAMQPCPAGRACRTVAGLSGAFCR